MKREIKFRGLIKNGTWAYGMPCKSNYGIELVTELYHVDGAEWNEYGEDVNPETVGQFTGLKDKNGKEIYEWDIIKSNKTGWHQEVVYVEQYASFMGEAAGFLYQINMNEDCEVIGNVFENPELLKS